MKDRVQALILLGALVLVASAAFSGDVLRILNYPVFKKLTRPSVDFPHERHYDWGLGCLDCHHRYERGVNVLTENELQPGNTAVSCSSCHSTARDLERAYHRMCIRCHTDMKKRGTAHGPVMCGECHSKKENEL